MVAEARSAPVGSPPLVARRLDSVRLGGVGPVQPVQKRLMSALVKVPVTDGVNV